MRRAPLRVRAAFSRRSSPSASPSLRHLHCDPAQHIRRQRPVALLLLPFDLRAGLGGEASRLAAAQRRGVNAPYAVISVEADPLRQPRHRRRLDARLPCLLAHGQQRDVARVVKHVARRLPQLSGQRIEIRDEFLPDGSLLHGEKAIAAGQLLQHLFHAGNM